MSVEEILENNGYSVNKRKPQNVLVLSNNGKTLVEITFKNQKTVEKDGGGIHLCDEWFSYLEDELDKITKKDNKWITKVASIFSKKETLNEKRKILY